MVKFSYMDLNNSYKAVLFQIGHSVTQVSVFILRISSNQFAMAVDQSISRKNLFHKIIYLTVVIFLTNIQHTNENKVDAFLTSYNQKWEQNTNFTT